MVMVRRVTEEEVGDDEIGAFLAEQSRALPVRGCHIVPHEGEPSFEPIPIKKGDLVYLREQEYMVQGIYPNSPVYVLATVPEAGVFWGIYLRNQEKSVGGSFFNGGQVSAERTKPRRPIPTLATERQVVQPVAHPMPMPMRMPHQIEG
jgi:hypothetical protein